jgi:integrase
MAEAARKYENNNEGLIVNFPGKTKKDGTLKQTRSNSKNGIAHEVYPIKDAKQIQQMKDYFRNRITNADTQDHKRIAYRDLMMFTVGINIGLRASDLLNLTWGDVFDDNNQFNEGIRKKEKKTDKYKTFFLNSSSKNIISEYVEQCNPYIEKHIHIFKGRQGTLSVKMAGDILKEAAKVCGIKENVCSHTLRKTFAYWFLKTHQNDVFAINYLQDLLNHSSQAATLRYAGIQDEKNKELYNDMNL